MSRAVVLFLFLTWLAGGCASFVPQEIAIPPARAEFELGYIRGALSGQTFQDPIVDSEARKTFVVGAGLFGGYALSIDQRSRLARVVASSAQDSGAKAE